MKTRYTLLALILAVGFCLRVFRLDVRPLGFTWDEAALGYNAYSLLKTGADEYGVKLPIVLKSFGDYKPGLYAYFATLPVSILGLSEFSTRATSAVFGTLCILAIFLLGSRIKSPKLGLFSALLLAINPWAIHFSRGAWEANLWLCLTTLAIVSFISQKYFFSVLLFGLTLWDYQGAKFTTPLLLLGLSAINRVKIKPLVLPGIIFALFLLPIVLGFKQQSGRLQVYSVFNYTRTSATIQRILSQDGLSAPNKLFYFFHAEILDQAKGVLQRYLNHFSPQYLFLTGDWSNIRHSTPYYGYFHLPELFTLVLGIGFVATKKFKYIWVLLFWLFLTPLAAALSRDIVSGVRTLPMVIPYTLLSAIGLSQIVKKRWLLVPIGVLFVFFFIYYLDLFYIHSPVFGADAWLTAYNPAIQVLNTHSDEFNRVVFTNQLGQPYIFILFYNRVDPAAYQKQANLVTHDKDVGEVPGFDKYVFQPVNWPAQRGDKSTLFIGGQYELPEQDLNEPNLVRFEDIVNPDGTIAFRIVGLK